MSKLYRLLNKEAKGWWYHRQLRAQGRHEEARRRERASIRHSLEVIRKARLLVIGLPGNVSIELCDGSSLSAYDPAFYDAILPECVPRVDLRGEGHDHEVRVYMFAVNGPLPRAGAPEKPAYGPFDHAPLHDYLALAETLGFRVRWGRLAEKRERALARVFSAFPGLEKAVKKLQVQGAG